MKQAKLSVSTMQRMATLFILVVIMIALSFISDKYLNFNNLINIVRQESTLIIIASAATILMISGGMDLSPAGVMALTSVILAKLCVAGVSLPVAIMISLLVGAVTGLFSGLLVVVTNVPPMIATLGTWYITKGLAYALSHSYAIVQGLPENFGWISKYVGPFPLMVVIAAVIFIIFYIILNKTLLGKYAYAIGGNAETARLSGVRVKTIQCTLYVLTGLMSSIAGVLMSSRIGSGDPNLSLSGIEFEIIVAIILGGTSLLGGQGTLIGSLIGALILGNLSNGMNLLGIGTVYQFIVQGAVLIIAVVVDLFLKGNGVKIKKIRKA
ncbi:ribose transport system permease protein [Muricomes intestini]|uniref:Ribose transport system permease protein n=1 Tax=Muricomes intestini TaxID=1796634 RepID=A0A4R3JX31_9FIRM|nr:ABC transporter permease [Muricomes intestini]TCS72874.1 ribose transport system permease protein [Muricomes intestini]